MVVKASFGLRFVSPFVRIVVRVVEEELGADAATSAADVDLGATEVGRGCSGGPCGSWRNQSLHGNGECPRRRSSRVVAEPE